MSHDDAEARYAGDAPLLVDPDQMEQPEWSEEDHAEWVEQISGGESLFEGEVDEELIASVDVEAEISIEAFETEKDLRDWVRVEWENGLIRGHQVLDGEAVAPVHSLGFSRAFLAGFEAKVQMSGGRDVAPGFTCASQIRQYEEEYRRLQADKLIKDSAAASMKPLMHEHRSAEHDDAMGWVEKFGSWSPTEGGRGEWLPNLIRPIDVDAVPLSVAKKISLDAARESICKRMLEMAKDPKLTTRVDMRFDLGVDLLCPQVVFAKVPQASRAFLARGERVWAFYYLPELWLPRDGGPARTSWWHAGDWVPDPVDPQAPGKFIPGVWGCVAVYTDESKAARECKALLKAVLTLRRISAENADGIQYEDDPVRDVVIGADGTITQNGREQIFEL